VRIGYVPQKIDADRHLPLTYKDLFISKSRILKVTAEIDAISQRVGLTQKMLATPIGHLSGGQFQRGLIGFALIGNPNVLPLDEPTASIDESAEEHIYELIHRLQNQYKLAVITVSHDLSFVYRYATKVLCLHRRIVLYGRATRSTYSRDSRSTLWAIAPLLPARTWRDEPGPIDMTAAASYSIVLALLTAFAAGLVGSFALMKRMSLAGDVISHIALPGLGLALLLGFNPLLGAATTLFLGTLLIWRLQNRGTLTTDVAIGVIFTAALAIGTLVTPSEDLIEALFGGFQSLTLSSFSLGVLAVLGIVTFIYFFRHKLILTLFSPELAAATAINVKHFNLYYLLVFSLTVLLGLRFLGALLVGVLIIIPAATGRQLTHTLTKFLIASSAVSVLSVAIGLVISH
jgi:ABC-type Mn2+/Zn2+ transport system permease subunit